MVLDDEKDDWTEREVKVIDRQQRDQRRGQDVDWDTIHKLDRGRISQTFARVLDKWES